METTVDEFDLAQFDEEFSQAEVEENEYEEVPDGRFQVNVDKVELTHAQTSGNLMLKWKLQIISARFEGKILWRNNVIATPENIKWLKTDLHTCGLDIEKLSDLPANLEQLLDVKLEVVKKSKGENSSVFFNKRIITEDGATSSSTSDALKAF